MSKRRQFRIKYYNFDDSQLYIIIQIAPTRGCAISQAQTRLEKSVNNFKILEMEELGTEFYIKEIRRILTNAIKREREMVNGKEEKGKRVKTV